MTSEMLLMYPTTLAYLFHKPSLLVQNIEESAVGSRATSPAYANFVAMEPLV